MTRLSDQCDAKYPRKDCSGFPEDALMEAHADIAAVGLVPECENFSRRRSRQDGEGVAG
jgi:hypothetical protein